MLRLTVVAHPGAGVERVEVLDDDTLGVWVRARPVEGQANAAMQQLVARVLGLRPRQVNVVAGAAARRKILEVDLPDVQVLRERVMAYGLRADAR